MSNPIIVHDQPAAKTYSPAEGSPQSGCASRDAAPPVTPKRETITIERKMRDLGLTFEPATLREALKRQGKEGK